MNKPRVFLSHSKKNSVFIERLADDLRRCQIEPWIDTLEIRHGKSWQDAIFQYGLPTCDAVIVYFTELSLQSLVVKKEMDVALLQNLKDSNVAFLPYVNKEEIRGSLRPDIQALQTPEWNDDNYYSLLPRVVAEIWRSFLERTISQAVHDERLKRTQLELELEKRNKLNDDVFSSSEIREFEYIYRNLNKVEKINIDYINRYSSFYENDERNYKLLAENVHAVEFNFLELISELSNIDKDEFNLNESKRWLLKELYKVVIIDKTLFESFNLEGSDRLSFRVNEFPKILDNLRLYGFVETRAIESEQAERWDDKVSYRYIFSEKYFRYRYWLAYNGKLPSKLNLTVIDEKK